MLNRILIIIPLVLIALAVKVNAQVKYAYVNPYNTPSIQVTSSLEQPLPAVYEDELTAQAVVLPTEHPQVTLHSFFIQGGAPSDYSHNIAL